MTDNQNKPKYEDLNNPKYADMKKREYKAKDPTKRDRPEVTSVRIRQLCTMFDVSYEKTEQLNSLNVVLDLVLNKFSDAEFKGIPYPIKLELTRYGDAITQGRLKLHRIHTESGVGVSKKIHEYIRQGYTERATIQAKFEEDGVKYRASSFPGLVSKARKEAGLLASPRKSPCFNFIAEQFNHGRGLTSVAEMKVCLEEAGVPHTYRNVVARVGQLRRLHGLTTKSSKRRKRRTY